MTKIFSAVAIGAVAGALALAGSAAAQQKSTSFKCWGVAKAGHNDCANAAKTHDCAGQSKSNYDLGDWKAVKDASECTKLGGSTKPGKGANPKAPQS